MIEWDEENKDWVHHKKYHFPSLRVELEKHFEEGGSSTIRVIAGICEVSATTIHNWCNQKHREYHPEFHNLISEYKNIAAKLTDDAHRKAAFGQKKIFNERTLNRRFEKICEGIETQITSTANYGDKLRIYTESYLNNEISTDVFTALTKGMEDYEVESALDKMRQVLAKQENLQTDTTKE